MNNLSFSLGGHKAKKSFETKICLDGYYIFEWLLFLFEYKVTFVKSSGH
jgi:hypothetical protein